MPSKDLTYNLVGHDKSASKTITGVATNAEASSKRIGSAFNKAGSLIGGEFGEILNKVGEGFDQLGEKGTNLGKRLTVGGAGLMGVGALLTGIGDKEKAASQQLDQAITNTGHSADDFTKQIDGSVHSMEKYGYTAVTTKDALTILTNATHDPAKAISMMGEAADLAASKHESLTTAADQLAKLLGGKGTRTLASYGIQIRTNADGTKDYAGANQRLAQILSGQASAASDTLTGKLKQLRAEAEDQVAVFGQKYGPAITAAGTAMTAAGGVAQILAARQARAAEAAAGNAAATTDESVAIANEGRVAAATAGELTGLAGARARAGTAAEGGAVGSVAAGGMGAGASLAMRGSIAGVVALAVKEGFDTGISQLSKGGGAGAGIAGVLGGLGGDPQKNTPGWAKEAGSWGKALANPLTTVQKLGGAFDSLFGSHKKVTKSAKDAAAAQDTLAQDTQFAADKAAIAASDFTDYTTALGNLGKTQISDLHSQDAFLSSLDSLTQSVKDNGTSLSVNSEKGRANREAFLSAGEAALSYAQSQQQSGVATNTVTANLEKNVGQLIQTAEHAGMSKTAVKALIAQMGLTPSQIATYFAAHTGSATTALTTYVHKLRSIDGTTVQTYVEVTAIGKGAGYMQPGGTHPGGGYGGASAEGSPFEPGGQWLVGERGPEVVSMPRGAKVTPYSASGTRSYSHDGGPITINIINHPGADGLAAGRAVAKALEPYLAAGGRIAGLS